MAPGGHPLHRVRAAMLALGLAVGACWLPLTAMAQRGESGVTWQELKPAERTALKPLEQEWRSLPADQKQKWVELAVRFPTYSADERSRIQARMTQWVQMTPHERGQARINFQEAKQVAPADRQAQWEAYQALSPEQKRELAARAVPPARPTAHPASPIQAIPMRPAAPEEDTPTAKTNIVPNPAHAQAPRQVAPTVVQAQAGATTSLINNRPVPPPHQQTGLPKIAATPEFVDRATLLPRRGPQAAATRSAAASTQPAATPR